MLTLTLQTLAKKDENGRLIKAPTEIYSAYKVSDGVSSFVLSNGSRQNNLSVSVNGEESYSGESLELGGDYKFRNNCYKNLEINATCSSKVVTKYNHSNSMDLPVKLAGDVSHGVKSSGNLINIIIQ